MAKKYAHEVIGFMPWDEDGDQPVPVRARHIVEVEGGEDDLSAEVLLFDVAGDISPSAQAIDEYEGYGPKNLTYRKF